VKNLIISIFLVLLAISCSTSKTVVSEESSEREAVVYETDTDVSEDSVQISVEDKEMFDKHLSKISYPEIALENEVMGTVKLKFRVNANGEVDDISVVSEKIGYGLEEEAIRVLKLTSGQWEANSEIDNVYYILPIKFVLY
jgi:TonB family protein